MLFLCRRVGWVNQSCREVYRLEPQSGLFRAAKCIISRRKVYRLKGPDRREHGPGRWAFAWVYFPSAIAGVENVTTSQQSLPIVLKFVHNGMESIVPYCRNDLLLID